MAASSPLTTKQQHIKRPMNPFMIFGQEQRSILQRLHPKEPNSTISCLIGQAWHALSVTDRSVYVEKAKQFKEEHQQKYPTYKYVPAKRRRQQQQPQPQQHNKPPRPQRKTLKAAVLSTVCNLSTVRNKLNLHIQVPHKEKEDDDNVDMHFPVLSSEFMTAAFSKANKFSQLEIFFEQSENVGKAAGGSSGATTLANDDDDDKEEEEEDVFIYENKSCDLVSPVDTNKGVIFLWTTDMQNVLTQPIVDHNNKRLSGEGVADFFSHDFDF